MKATKIEKDTQGEAIAMTKELSANMESVLYWTGVLMAVFHIWVNTVGVMPEIQRNAVHFGFVLFNSQVTRLVQRWQQFQVL